MIIDEHPIQIPSINLTGTNPAMLGWHRETTPLLTLLPKDEDLTIFIIGAYSGTIAKLLLEQYPGAKHCLLEPQDWACEMLRGKFGGFPNVTVYQKGLGDRSGIFRMGLYKSYDCSFMRGGIPFKDGTWYDAELAEFGAFMQEEGVESISYATLNIESYEYVLLPHMARIGWLEKCQVLGLSWHDARFNTPVKGPYTWLGEPVVSYEDVQEILQQTHRIVLEIDNWQTWERREVDQ